MTNLELLIIVGLKKHVFLAQPN